MHRAWIYMRDLPGDMKAQMKQLWEYCYQKRWRIQGQ